MGYLSGLTVFGLGGALAVFREQSCRRSFHWALLQGRLDVLSVFLEVLRFNVPVLSGENTGQVYRDRETPTQRERDTETERQRERDTERERERDTPRERERQRERDSERDRE